MSFQRPTGGMPQGFSMMPGTQPMMQQPGMMPQPLQVGQMQGMMGGQMQGGPMQGRQMQGGQMQPGQMQGQGMMGGPMQGGQMQGGHMQVGPMQGAQMQGGPMQGGPIQTGQMQQGTMAGGFPPQFGASGQHNFRHGMPQMMPAGMGGQAPGMGGQAPGMGMAPRNAPPAYTPQMAQNFRSKKNIPQRQPAPVDPRQQLKERHFQEQQSKLKHFHNISSSHSDASKMIEAIVGKVESPRDRSGSQNSTPREEAQEVQIANEADDFGDFLSGPSIPTSAVAPPIQDTNAGTNVVGQSPTQGVQDPSMEKPSDKKDLRSMMLECSDLSVPNKAKGFVKPALSEVQPKHVKHQTFHESKAAKKWDYNTTENLSDLFVLEKPIESAPVVAKPEPKKPHAAVPPSGPPKWLIEGTVPIVYEHVYEASLKDDKIDTGLVYPILLRSGLPREALGHIWALANKETPGQLNKQELFMIIALIAVAQNNINVTTVDILARCPQAPVPNLGQHAAPAASSAPSSGAPVNMSMVSGMDTSGAPSSQMANAFPPHSMPASQSGILSTAMPAAPSNIAPGQPGTAPGQPGIAPGQPGLAPGQPSIAPGQPGIVPGQPGIVPGQPGIAPGQPSITQVQPGAPDDDDDFADFQAAPSPTLHQSSSFGDFTQVSSGANTQPSGSSIPPLGTTLQPPTNTFPKISSESDLLGAEDKYAFLRSMDSSPPAPKQPKDGSATLPEIPKLALDSPVSKTSPESPDDFANFEKYSEAVIKGNLDVLKGSDVDSPRSVESDENEMFKRIKHEKLMQKKMAASTASTEDWADFQTCDIPEPAAKKNEVPKFDKMSILQKFNEPPPKPIKLDQAEDDVNPSTSDQQDDDDWANFESAPPFPPISTNNLTITRKQKYPKMDDDQSKMENNFSSNNDNSDFGAFSMVPPPMQSQSSPPKTRKMSSKTRLPSLDDDSPMFEPPPFEQEGESHTAGVFGDFFSTDPDAQPNKHLEDMFEPKPKPKKQIPNRNTTKPENQVDMTEFTSHLHTSASGPELYNLDTVKLRKDGAGDSQSVSSLELPPFHNQSKSLKEDNQSVSSLEFKTKVSSKEGSMDNQSVSSFEFQDRKPSISQDNKSVGSLDFKGPPDEATSGVENGNSEADDNFGDFSVAPPPLPVLPTGAPKSATEVMSESGPQIGVDRYSSIMHDVQDQDRHAVEWEKCLQSCCDVITNANSTFNSVSSSAVCSEIIGSEQGKAYLIGIVEIYRVVCKINLAIKMFAIHNDNLTMVLKNIDLNWNNLTAFIAGNPIMPPASSLDFTAGIVRPGDDEADKKACGVCLLNVDSRSKAFDKANDCHKLTYGGKQYHAPCANFWVNCVDSMLPSLPLPQLI